MDEESPLAKVIEGMSSVNISITHSPSAKLQKVLMAKDPITLRPSNFLKLAPDLPLTLVDTYTKICSLYDQLQIQMNLLSEKVDAVIMSEGEYLLAVFRQQMLDLQTDLKRCDQIITERARAKEQLAARKVNTQKLLEEQLKLADLYERQQKRVASYKQVADILKKENVFFEKQVKKLKKENVILKNNLNRLLEKLNAKCDSEFSISPKKEEVKNKFKTVEEHLCESNTRMDKFFKLVKDPENHKECYEYWESIIEKHEKNIHLLKHQLRIEKWNLHKLKVMQASVNSSRLELEQIFYDCVEEVKKQITTRRQQELRHSLLYCYPKSTPILKPPHKVQIMEKFMTNETLLQSLYSLIFNKDNTEQKYTLAPVNSSPLTLATPTRSISITPNYQVRKVFSRKFLPSKFFSRHRMKLAGRSKPQGNSTKKDLSNQRTFDKL